MRVLRRNTTRQHKHFYVCVCRSHLCPKCKPAVRAAPFRCAGAGAASAVDAVRPAFRRANKEGSDSQFTPVGSLRSESLVFRPLDSICERVTQLAKAAPTKWVDMNNPFKKVAHLRVDRAGADVRGPTTHPPNEDMQRRLCEGGS